jgi:hypothetical protein
MLVHGGVSFRTVLTDTWEWTGTSWVQHTGAGPGPRWLHGLAHDFSRQRTVLFGGASAYTSGATSADTWEWDGMQWLQRMPATSPSARAAHTLAYDAARGRVVLFGGATDWMGTATVLNDTWEWDGSNWTQRFPTAAPSPRLYHSMIYDVARAAVVVFGGRVTLTGAALADAWQWDAAANTWRLLTVSGTGIGARDLAAFACDRLRGRVLTVGGEALGARFNDTWELLPSLPNATALAYGAGCAGSAGIPQLSANGPPKLGNANFMLQLGNARASSPTALLLSEARDSIAIGGGCSLLVASPFFTIGTNSSASGTVTWPLPVANNVAWLGLEICAQQAVADPAGAFAGLAAVSNGIALTLGN